MWNTVENSPWAAAPWRRSSK
uniref:Uncharacterized protein n=1 Tax=Anguilla anguilla TaxID=7936 RepID=A0A0E9SJ27_ANGAN